MKKILLYVPFLVLAACGGKDKEAEVKEPEKQAPLTQSKNSEAFNASFDAMLANYYHLKDALVLSKDTADKLVDPSAKLLQVSTDSLKFAELKGDAAISETARSFAGTISTEAAALLGQKSLEDKRKSFQNISEAMYTLIQTVRYDKQVVFHQFCPMAFNDAGAFWLSNSSDVKNPYFGPKMLTCGEVKDSLNFAAQQ